MNSQIANAVVLETSKHSGLSRSSATGLAMPLTRRQLLTLSLMTGVGLALAPVSNALAANCVDEVYADGFWKNHKDAFAGAGVAGSFDDKARSMGYQVDGSPRVGDVVVWEPNKAGAFGSGHVAIVTRAGGGTIDIREQNWNGSAPGSSRKNVSVQAGMSFVHVPRTYKTEQYQTGSKQEQYQSGTRQERYQSGTKQEQYQSGTKQEQYQSGTKQERYQSGTKQEQYQSGTRQERYQSGWKDNWVWRTWRFVNERTPVYATRNVPVYSTRTVPVYATRTVPVYATRNVPVYSTRTVPVYATRNVPVYSTRTVPVYGTRTVPVY
jgi:hypothetical protein